jgi:nucleotide-binding universal stress UspA family protein
MPADRLRKFVVVVDQTPECPVALRYATRRAQHTNGHLTLFCAAEPGEFQQWKGVETIMREEAHKAAEALLHNASKYVNELSGIVPELVIEHGRKSDGLLELIKRDRDVSVLVLAASAAKEGPGPLVSLFAGPSLHRIPVTIVPGGLTEEEIDSLS